MALASSIFEARPMYDGVGNVVSGAKSSAEAIKLAGLDWTAEKQSLMTARGAKIPDYYGVVRTDTNKVLGVVSKRYKPVQNAEAFSFVDELLGNGVQYETAGAIRDGKRVWMLAKMDDGNDYKLAGDKCVPYLLFSNSFDGKSSVKVCLTVTRVWCENTLNMALKNAQRVWSVTHAGDIKYKIEEARNTLELTSRYLANMQETADSLTQIAIAPNFIADMAQTLFPYKDSDSDIIQSRAKTKQNALTALYDTKEDIKPFKGTAWGAYLALTDWASHAAPDRETDTARMNSMVKAFDGAEDVATVGARLIMSMV